MSDRTVLCVCVCLCVCLCAETLNAVTAQGLVQTVRAAKAANDDAWRQTVCVCVCVTVCVCVCDCVCMCTVLVQVRSVATALAADRAVLLGFALPAEAGRRGEHPTWAVPSPYNILDI